MEADLIYLLYGVVVLVLMVLGEFLFGDEK